jgi:hypothetical protein
LSRPLVQAGLFGPHLTALVTYLKGRLHGSYSGIRDFLGEVLGVSVSRGYLAKLCHKATEAFAAPLRPANSTRAGQYGLECKAQSAFR